MEDRAPVDGSDVVPMSVAALKRTVDECVALTCHVVVSDGIATISDLLAESFPPQPGGAQLRILNPELLDIADSESFGATTWTAVPTQLVGRCVNGWFVIDEPQVETQREMHDTAADQPADNPSPETGARDDR